MENNIEFETKISADFVKKFQEKVNQAHSIVITSHKSPDDDSIASVLAVYEYVTKYLHIDEQKVKIIYSGEKDSRWNDFKNYNKVNYVDDVANNLSGVDLIIVLDCQGWSRFIRIEKNIEYDNDSILIDHHPIPANQFKLQLIASNYSSTAEIVYDLFYKDVDLEKNICETLLLGILGDTGNFRYISYKNSNVLDVAKRLINVGGINVDAFSNRYQKISKYAYEILIELMKNSKIGKIDGWPDFVYSFIDYKKCVKNNYVDNDISEGASNFTAYLRSIEGVDWGMVITPRMYDSTHSVSFRSSPGSVVTREIGEKMGIGGGHDRASGGKIKTKDTKKTVKQILNWMSINKPSFS